MKTVAKALIYAPNDHILMLRRSNTHPHFPLQLDFPGGEVEAGEAPADAVQREIYEETGLTVESATLKPIFEKRVNPQTTHLLFSTSLDSTPSNIQLSWEHVEAEWLAIHELLAYPTSERLDAYYTVVVAHLRATR